MGDRDVISDASRALVELLGTSLVSVVDKRKIDLVTVEGLRRHKPEMGPAVSVLLYAVTGDPMRRPGSSAGPSRGSGAPELGAWVVHLHYVLIPWDLDAKTEQRILGAVLGAICKSPVISTSERHAGEPGGGPLNLMLEEMPFDRMHEVWTGMGVPWRAAVWCRVRCPLNSTGEGGRPG